MRMVRTFTPNWFTAGMGTGIVAVDAYLLPHGPGWLSEVGTGLWIFNLILVSVLIVLMIGRSVVDPHGVKEIFHDPLQSMFFGAIPMAMTTVVNGFFDMGPRFLGSAAYHVGAILWVVNAAIALASVFVIPFLMFISHDHRLSHMTAAWLMPIVPAEVVAASSGILVPHLTALALRQDLFIGTVVLWALSVPMAFLLLGTLFLRLALHNLPPQEMAISTWITLGTLGTGIMGLMMMAKDSSLVFPGLASAIAGAATLAAIILWGLGLWWFVHSMLISAYYLWRRSLPFNLGWWGLTFPLGVFGAGTDLLYHALGTAIFSWAAATFFLMLALFWILVATFTVRHLMHAQRAKHGVMNDAIGADWAENAI
ncbi:MAG: C4-dicarboxylate ABC transporter [Sulfobacillus acidophilus]|uniref:C4-dicarboxylate ABC transporter n=1 Tax=Sulfobacillus acidophilus TaxID=53633 RepID=A0A2T2WEA3_9FIRM|nr:MAG: C4-dicarboxylate ABC transporter [Sulfobacillus acidophilus]